jgi:hypothetical protein
VSINALMKFVQSKDVFVYDYIVTVKICQVDLYKMYGYSNTSFQVTNFPKFIDCVINTYCRIAWDWVIDLNDGTQHLLFQIMGQSHMVHLVDLLTILHFPITCDDFEAIITTMNA